MKNNRKIFINSYPPVLHSMYSEIFDHPPENYEFINKKQPQLLDKIYFVNKNYKFRKVKDFIFNNTINSTQIKDFLYYLKPLPKNTDLIFSTGYIVKKQVPWVTDAEILTIFSGYDLEKLQKYKKYYQKHFESDFCKKIMPWNNDVIRSFQEFFKSEIINEKLELLQYAVTAHPEFIKKRQTNKITILFVGSANIDDAFYIKGGVEALEIMKLLSEKYDDLHFKIIANVPEKEIHRCEKINNLEITGIIPRKKVEEYLKSADILLNTSPVCPAMAMIEAMSYEVLVVAPDISPNLDIITDGKTGVLFKKQDDLNYYKKYRIYNSKLNEQILKRPYVGEIVGSCFVKLVKIVDNFDDYKNIAKNGREMVENGKMSISFRNKKLKKIFDKIK